MNLSRWPYLLVPGQILWVVLVAWTVRASWPDRDAADATADHYLPLHGAKLFALTGGPDGRYTVSAAGAGCDADTVVIDGELRCDGARFFVRDDGRGHELVLEGFAVSLPATVGSGREADAVFPVPGMGAEHLELLPVDACEADPSVPHPTVCVRNGGAGGTLVVDRSARQSETAPIPRTREAPDHGATALIDELDLVWAGPVPLRLRAQDGEVLISVPREEWTTIAGDRRWMSLALPTWPLSDGEATAAETHVFWSREALFTSAIFPLPWDTHLADRRVEWEQEELLQRFVDHELLCWDAPALALRWNLVTGSGCDGRAIPPPPAAIWRRAEQAAYQPGTKRLLDVTARDLAGLPEETPDPAALVFVFDWAWALDGDERRRVPTRLLGVRPGATVNGPARPMAEIPSDDPCAIAKSGARPPIEVSAGSSSAALVVTGGPLAAGSRLMLPDRGALCVWAGKATGPGDRLEPAASPKLALPAMALTLGTVHVQTATDARMAWWSPGIADTLPKGAHGACATLTPGEGGWAVVSSGDAGLVRVGDVLGEGSPLPLADGARLRVGSGADAVDAVFFAASDRAAESRVADGHAERRYPFGSDLSPVVGYGPFAGGLEGAGTEAFWEAATADFRDGACGQEPRESAVVTTIDGDLQRIVATELAAVAEACAEGAPSCPDQGDGVDASAVLLDARTGKILAVANAPAFDPGDADQVEALHRALRLAGPQGSIRAPTLENRAFLRASNAGSVYKLATSYTLARTGRLKPDGSAPAAFGCTRFTWYAEQPEGELLPDWTPDGKRSQPCGKHGVVLDPAAGFHEAFRRSINLFFGIAPFAVIEGSGVDWAQPRYVSGLSDPLENPLDGAGLFAWSRGEGDARRTDLGLVLSDELDVAHGLGDNAFLDTLVRIGHRFHYARAGGGVLYTQRADGVGDIAYPTVESPWLPGLRVGSGFRYPSLLGPEAYAIEGKPGWASRDITIAVKRDGKAEPTTFRAATSSIREWSRLGYGMGGVEASALSLAVMASPMAREDGGAVSPWLISTPAVGGGGAVPGVVGEGRAELEAAMRAVVAEPGSTAYGYFPEGVASRIGGKTGTYEIARLTSALGRDDPATWASIERIARYGCGVQGVDVTAADWTRLDAALDTPTRRGKRHLGERPYVQPVLDALIEAPPARGFASSASSCVDWELNPGRAGVGAVVAGTDAGLWLDATLGVFPRDLADEELVEGSSFVAVVFDGLVDAAEPGQAPAGQGWVLAVVVDGHPTAGKRAAARILERLQQHLAVRTR